MDKWEKKFILKIILAFNIIFIIGSAVINLMSGTIMKCFDSMLAVLCVEFVLFGIPFCVIECSMYFTKKKEMPSLKQINREINEEYTPAMASILIDNNIEDNKDILATILDLSVRKYLKIINN